MIYIIHSKIVNVVIPDSKIFLWIAVSVADAPAVNPNSIKILLANGFTTFFIKGKPVFSNGPRSLPRNPPDYTIWDNCFFNNFILADELFAKSLWSLENCVLVKNNFCAKSVSSIESPTTFDERFKVTLVPFFIHDFNLLSCELGNFTLKVFYCVILY